MRKIGIVFGILVVVLIIGIAIFAATFDVNRYRGRIQAELEHRLDRKVSLGQMHLSVLPPRFQVQNIAISEDPKFPNPKPFVQADRYVDPKRRVMAAGRQCRDHPELRRGYDWRRAFTQNWRRDTDYAATLFLS